MNPIPAAELDPTSVLFEDHHLVVVCKPAPLLTQAPPVVPSLESMVKGYIKRKFDKPAGVYLGVPHRLDRAVSGVVCFARNTKAAQRVHSQFAEHTTKKVYWAVVAGSVTPDADVWSDWLVKRADVAETVIGKEGEPGAKLAMLGYRVLKRLDAATVLELSPLTGRMHQLRVQCASRGFPVLGDEKYGSTVAFGPPAELPRERVIALHARQLTLTHPFTKEAMTWTAELPAYWAEVSANSTGTAGVSRPGDDSHPAG